MYKHFINSNRNPLKSDINNIDNKDEFVFNELWVLRRSQISAK